MQHANGSLVGQQTTAFPRTPKNKSEFYKRIGMGVILLALLASNFLGFRRAKELTLASIELENTKELLRLKSEENESLLKSQEELKLAGLKSPDTGVETEGAKDPNIGAIYQRVENLTRQLDKAKKDLIAARAEAQELKLDSMYVDAAMGSLYLNAAHDTLGSKDWQRLFRKVSGRLDEKSSSTRETYANAIGWFHSGEYPKYRKKLEQIVRNNKESRRPCPFVSAARLELQGIKGSITLARLETDLNNLVEELTDSKKPSKYGGEFANRTACAEWTKSVLLRVESYRATEYSTKSTTKH